MDSTKEKLARMEDNSRNNDAVLEISNSTRELLSYENPKRVERCKHWISDPFNMAFLLWIICVVVSASFLILLMTGLMNNALPNISERYSWLEFNNQVLNALFTLWCLYHHPKRFHHLVLLCTWRPNDVLELRATYCKGGGCKPKEWVHMMIVVVLLHVNCFAQYTLFGLTVGFRQPERPVLGLGICLIVAIASVALARLYCKFSPLGRDYSSDCRNEVDGEAQDQVVGHHKKRVSSAVTKEHDQPVWRGDLFNVQDDVSVAWRSLLCCFCVFGWNMERLGLGNTYVHIAKFILFCGAPVVVFCLAAINIDNNILRKVLEITGIVLSIFGLLYGGYWRIQMRKRFNLPPNNSCCNNPNFADSMQWLFCCWCSLAQEVRTGDVYKIVDDESCKKEMDAAKISPLPPQSGKLQLGKHQSASTSSLSVDYYMDDVLKPPVSLTMQRKET